MISKQESTQEKHHWMAFGRWNTTQNPFLLTFWSNTGQKKQKCKGEVGPSWGVVLLKSEVPHRREIGETGEMGKAFTAAPGVVLAEERPGWTSTYWPSHQASFAPTSGTKCLASWVDPWGGEGFLAHTHWTLCSQRGREQGGESRKRSEMGTERSNYVTRGKEGGGANLSFLHSWVTVGIRSLRESSWFPMTWRQRGERIQSHQWNRKRGVWTKGCRGKAVLWRQGNSALLMQAV